jgi:formate-nitrite transporter family protein
MATAKSRDEQIILPSGRTEHPLKLDEVDRKQVDEERSLSASVTYEIIRKEGEKELERTSSTLAWSALAAGLSMGLSLAAAGVLHSHLPDASWRPLVVNFGYAVGFLIVILGSQQLYTENTIMPIVPLLAAKTARMARNVARLWTVVLLGNLLGALLFALVIARTSAFEPEVHRAFESISLEAIAPGFGTIFLRAIFAGWIIALMVWMLPAAGALEAVIIVAMAWLVGAGSLSHVIAGAVEVFYLTFRGITPIAEGLVGYILPALLGNTVGGVALVATLNHAQVAGTRRQSS